MPEEPQEAIKAALLDRLTHPVMGIFLLSLAVCNWKPVTFIVISDMPAKERIQTAEEYVNLGSLLGFPLLLTAIWVLGGPILKVLALIYDRYVTDWEKVRAYKAALQVVERNTAQAANALSRIEADLANARNELATVTQQAAEKQAALSKNTEALEIIAKVGSQGWQSFFAGGGRFPFQPGTENYVKAKTKFDLIESFRGQVLGSGG